MKYKSMQSFTLVLVCAVILLLVTVAAETEFNFMSRSEVLRDGERIHGIRSSENKTFVLGDLFPVHEEGSISEGLRCADVRIALDVEAMLYAIDIVNADSNLLPGVELGYIRYPRHMFQRDGGTGGSI